MEFLKAVDDLLNNPKEEYYAEDDPSYIMFNSNERIFWKDNKNNNWDIIINKENYKRNWIKIKQPVTWQEAIQAWLDGKMPYVELVGGEYDITGVFGSFFVKDIPQVLSEGKWYIK